MTNYNSEKFIIGNSTRKPTTPHSFDEIENLLQSIEDEELQNAKLSEGKTSKSKESKIPKVNKKKGTNIVLKASDAQSPSQSIIPPTSNLSFVTDINMYNEIIKYLDAEFPNHKNIFSRNLVFDEKENVMIGSTTYTAVAVDMFLKREMPDYRIANLTDLGKKWSMFNNFYEDVGLALRNLTKGINIKYAEHLFAQLKKRNFSEKDLPVYFNLHGLELDKNLNFNLTPESSYKIKARCLNWDDKTSYSGADDFGLPKKATNYLTTRELNTSKQALCGVLLGTDLDIYSCFEELNASGTIAGRIVLARVSGNNYSGGGKQ